MNFPQPYRRRSNVVSANTPQTITVRRAVTDDVPAIVNLVNSHALLGDVLPRSTSAVYGTIDDWFVAITGDEVLGCVSLLGYSSGLVEVRSLVVGSRYRNVGIGSRLLRALLAEAQQRRITTLFALTRKVAFFERFGFLISERNLFPEKVWHDCLQCPLLDACDETAMVWQFTEKPGQVSASQTDPPNPNRS